MSPFVTGKPVTFVQGYLHKDEETGKLVLIGVVVGGRHRRARAGDSIRTFPIADLGNGYYETRRTVYKLLENRGVQCQFST